MGHKCLHTCFQRGLSTYLPQDSIFMNFTMVSLIFNQTVGHISLIDIDLVIWHLSFKAKINSFTDWSSAYWENHPSPCPLEMPPQRNYVATAVSFWVVSLYHAVLSLLGLRLKYMKSMSYGHWSYFFMQSTFSLSTCSSPVSSIALPFDNGAQSYMPTFVPW